MKNILLVNASRRRNGNAPGSAMEDADAVRAAEEMAAWLLD